MSDKKIILIGNPVSGTSTYVSDLIEKMGEDIIIVEDNQIIHPKNLTADDVIHLGNEDVSTDQLLKMVQDLKFKSELDGFVGHINRTAREFAQLESIKVIDNSFMFDGGSKFIPSMGGTQARNYKGGKGKNKGRKF